MTQRLALIIGGTILVLGLIAVALAHAASNTFEPAGCVYNFDRREWICPSPGRGSIQSPGGDSGTAGDSGASGGSAGASGASSGSCK